MMTRTEWWFDDATFYDSGERELFLARQRIGDDGSTEVLLASGERRRFEDEDASREWLTSEEYRPIAALYDDFEADGKPIPQLEFPEDDQPSLLQRMHISL